MYLCQSVFEDVMSVGSTCLLIYYLWRKEGRQEVERKVREEGREEGREGGRKGRREGGGMGVKYHHNENM